MNLALWLERMARVRANEPALLEGTRIVADYRGFHAKAAALAAAMTARGVQPGDRIAIFMSNCPDYLVVMNATWIAGAAVVPVNAKLHPREAAWIATNSGAALCFATSNHAAALEAETIVDVVDCGAVEFAQMCEGEGRGAEPRAPDDLA